MGTPTRANFPQEILADTPPRPPKKVLTTPALRHGLEEGRKAVIEDAGCAVPQVNMNYFKGALLPPLRPEFGDLTKIVTQLDKAGHLVKNGPWTLFNVNPADSQDTENTIFKSFEEIARIVQTTARKLLPHDIRATTSFKCNPNMEPISSQRSNTALPDGYAILNEPLAPRDSRKPHWEDIVVPGEKKKGRRWQMINDNNRKLMWSMNHAMRDTARRRFVFGYTIENTSMRLWFCSRSDIIVSELFDFVKDHKILIHFFLSIMFATPSELGYDPTVVPARSSDASKKGNYDVLVRSSDGTKHYFRTTDVRSNIGAEPLRGRGTRVWRVNKLDEENKETGETFVLKDSWIDHDRTREGDILEQIRRSATKLYQKRLLDTYLLTVECHGDVFIGDEPDNTHSLLRRNQSVPQDVKMWPLKQPSPAAQDDNLQPIAPGFLPEIYVDEAKVVFYDVKSHYRIVFREDGTPIDKLTSLYDIWYHLTHVMLALQVIHECGWIHRDISAGNILVVGDGPKLVDFEYAKKVGDMSPVHIGRTGTEHYIPIEVKTGNWHFTPLDDFSSDSEAESEAAAADIGSFSANLFASRKRQNTADVVFEELPEIPLVNDTFDIPWRPNPLHDIESFWWLCIVLTICRAIVSINKARWTLSTAEQASQHSRFIQDLFSNFEVRGRVMTHSKTFRSRIKSLPSPLHPAALALDKFRTRLVRAYRSAELDPSAIDHTVANSLYQPLIKILKEFTDRVARSGIELSSIGVEFVIQHSQSTPHLAGLSFDSRNAQVGKHLRDEIEHGHLDFKFAAQENEGSSTAAADPEPDLKRLTLNTSVTPYPKSSAPSIALDLERESDNVNDFSGTHEASSSTIEKGKAPAARRKTATRPSGPNFGATEPRRSQRKKSNPS